MEQTNRFGEMEIDQALIDRFGGRGPRYTSYPTADRFTPDFEVSRYARELARLGASDAATPLGLYVHLPFCRSICYYCGCNKIVTKDQSRSTPYVEYLKKEIALVTELTGEGKRISHLHLGGGTPTFLTDEELSSVLAALKSHFDFAPGGEYSIEVDPRTVPAERAAFLASLGFNRMSLGIQDFDPDVQRAINRIQPAEATVALMQAARRAGFESINVDLIYGLPRQSEEGFARTLDIVMAAAPDRVALYHYAHLPNLFKSQRGIDEAELPSAQTRAALFSLAVERFTRAGYLYLGLDHFARTSDELAIAQREGRLHRNFQGYAAHDAGDIVSLGVSAISSVGGVYAQNEKTLDAYYSRLDGGELPIARGIALSQDDRIRRDVIQALMCNFRLEPAAIEARHHIRFDEYFAQSLASLDELARAGAVEIDESLIRVTAKGRLLVRAVCMAFDQHLRASPTPLRYSKIA